MKCIIPGVNLKVFGRAIHSLAKIGEELYLQPLEQGLSLRTVNSSRSAYACFLFFPSYFQHYDDGRKQTDASSNSEEEDEGLRCKMSMKSVMAVFRSLSTIEKTVEKCKITHNAKEARLMFELHCWHGIVKKHNLAYMESERLQAIFSKDVCPNRLTAPSKLLCEVVVNFQTTQEEVTLTVKPDILSLKNYVEDEPDPNKVVHTELSLAPEEFDLYQVREDTNITFCLKELRAILAFGETTGLPLSINFEVAGRPVTFSIDSDQTFEANFVLATLAEADQTTSSSQLPPTQRPQQPSASQRDHQRAAAASASQRGQHRQPSVSAAATATAAGKKQGDKRGTSGKSGAVNGRSSPSSRQPGWEDDDDDNDAEDINPEELAAAMEVEQDWEEQTAGGVPTLPQDQERERGALSHTHSTKRDRQAHSAEDETDPSSRSHTDRQTHRDRQTHGDRASGAQGKRDKPHSREDEKERNSRDAEREAMSPWNNRASLPERREGGAGERMGVGHGPRASEEEEEEEEGETASPVIPVQCPAADVSREGGCLQPLSGEEEDLDDTVPGTPPAKKFRSLFFGSSQKTSRPAHNSTVLAADTDDEDD